jgi:SAM-dependent methyltransferase
MEDYRAVNVANWDERAPAHAASPDYAVERLIADPALLSDVVRFDVPRLGDIGGLRGVHLQCHIGTDTLSLSRLGARMTGLDFSPASLAEARKIADRAGADIDYVQADVYAAPDVLDRGAYDLVYTGVGALGWLPAIARWADTVAALLRPGGRLFIREGHPVLFTVADPRPDGLLSIEYPYFEQPEPTVWDEGGTYVETDAVFTANRTHEWNHGLGETITALLAAGLDLTALVEHDTVPWDALPGMMTQVAPNEWQLTNHPERLPHTFTLQATRR